MKLLLKGPKLMFSKDQSFKIASENTFSTWLLKKCFNYNNHRDLKFRMQFSFHDFLELT